MAATNETYLGLMSGTSLDAIDAVLVRFSEHPARNVKLLAAREYKFPPGLHAQLQAAIESPANVGLETLGKLDRQLGKLYADTVNSLLDESGADRHAIAAIGNHGQTIRHSPDTRPAFTMQIGDAATIAAECGIPTVSAFRNADIALGGQGAPLVSAFHEWAFRKDDETIAVVNIGGIANVSLLRPSAPLLGFDTGPGNTLLDCWYSEHHEQGFDRNGCWSATGSVLPALLKAMLADPFFHRTAPKSTGREYFNRRWLESFIKSDSATAADIQATLAELTASSIAASIDGFTKNGNVWICGGGANNADLMHRIVRYLPDHNVASTAAVGIAPEWVEAIAFAWLARARLRGEAAGRPSVTGARLRAVLGCIHLPPKA